MSEAPTSSTATAATSSAPEEPAGGSPSSSGDAPSSSSAAYVDGSCLGRNASSTAMINPAEFLQPLTTHIDETLVQFEMFSTRKPRNLMAGTSSGLKSVAKGVVTGAVGLVTSPIQGAQQGGVQGFFLGLASGLFSAVALPVAGCAVGAFQVGRGAVNSVEASYEAAHGKDWDQEKREWFEYNLEEDAAKVQALDENGGEARAAAHTASARIASQARELAMTRAPCLATRGRGPRRPRQPRPGRWRLVAAGRRRRGQEAGRHDVLRPARSAVRCSSLKVAPLDPVAGSGRLGGARAYAPRSAASTAWRLAVASAARPRPPLR